MPDNPNIQFHISLVRTLGVAVGQCCQRTTLVALIRDISACHGGRVLLAWFSAGLADVLRARRADQVSDHSSDGGR